MANNGPIVNHSHYNQQSHDSQLHCKECGLFFDSAKSLDVHVQYHKENLLTKWASQAASGTGDETNNNTRAVVKREFGGTVAAPADSSGTRSPDPSSIPTSASFGHPATPQSFSGAPSPYQSAQDGNSFHTNFKSERNSPAQYQTYSNHYEPQHQQTQQQYFNMEPLQQYQQYRYHPYHTAGHFDRAQVTSSSRSPSYAGGNPTPSPSPKQCDKCGFVCESAPQLLEHVQLHHQFQFPDSGGAVKDEPQAEILDLDSHKVHVYQTPEEQAEALKRQHQQLAGVTNHPHSVSAMLQTWPQQQPQVPKPSPAPGGYGVYTNGNTEQKLFHQQHQMHPSSEFLGGNNGVSTTSQQSPYSAQPVISSTHATGSGSGGNGLSAPLSKGANWKSNEARRPKTYNCSACNKWFTSSGHLKRHYNTTLHKNAVKTSGQPDPATLPISAHHHPNRDPTHPVNSHQGQSQGRGQHQTHQSENSPPPPPLQVADTGGGGDDTSAGAYDRQTQLPVPYGLPPTGLQASPPNGGLLQVSTAVPTAMSTYQHMHASPGSYPNGLSPHATLATAAMASPHSLTSIGEQRPLPSFAQFLLAAQLQQHLPGNVGGQGPATDPYLLPQYQLQHQLQLQLPHEQTLEHHQLDTSPLSHHQVHQLDGGHLHHELDNDPEDDDEFITPDMDSQMVYSQQQQQDSLAEYHQIQQQYIKLQQVELNHQNADLETHHVTELQPMQRTLIIKEEREDLDAPYSPPNHNNNINQHHHQNNMHHHQPQQSHQITNMVQIKSVEHLETSSPLITSTGSPNASKNNNNSGSNTIQRVVSSQTNCAYKCIDCDKVFNKACYLTQHNKTFHSGDKPYKCNRCGKRFASESVYEEHAAKHAGEKPHKCEQCPKQFNHKTDLRRHMCLHTGLKPYTCETCGKGFIRKDHMLKHCETHLKKDHRRGGGGGGGVIVTSVVSVVPPETP